MVKINVVQRCKTWEFRIHRYNYDLVEKDDVPKKDVIDFANILCRRNNDKWDIAHYKDLVIFKDSCDRTTTIYSKDYWEYRMSESFNKLDRIHID